MVRLFGHYCSASQLLLFLAEATALVGGAMLGSGLVAHELASGSVEPLPFVLAAVATLVTYQICLYLGDLYDVRVAGRDRSDGTRLLRWIGIAAVVLGSASWLRPHLLPPPLLLGAAACATASVLALRAALPMLIGRKRRVLVLGTGARAMEVARAIEKDSTGEVELVGFVGNEPGEAPEPLRLEESKGYERLCVANHATTVVVAVEERRGCLRTQELLGCRMRGFEVIEAAHFCEAVLRRLPVSELRPSYLLFSEGWTLTVLHRFVKRAFDVVVASLLLVIASPVMALVAAVVRLSSPGPILFRQERVGKAGRPYTLVKFRTMREDAESLSGPVWAKERDPRITRIGAFLRKTRLDELPQIFNVLAGSMSFVGPRPERPFFTEQLRLQIPFFDLRLAVKPGITGWAQILYPYGASVEDARSKLEFDLYYLKNGSPFLDAVIVFHTVKHVLFGRGAR
ncbi:MAG: TIGR03013 family XrtA/PEP-CTERM system glycosyltransferase [Deltaproteobacteria bacterium]